MTATSEEIDLTSHYKLSSEQVEHFRTQGFVKLRNVLSPKTLAHYGQEITRQVFRLNEQQSRW